MQEVKKADVILVVCIIIVLAVGGAITYFCFFSRHGDTVSVTVDGTVIYEQKLADECELPITTSDGYNTLVVKNGEAFILDADCAEQICVAHKPISMKKQSIVCLPHKLVVEIK